MHTPEDHYMDWVPGDLVAVPEAETAVVSMTVDGVPLTIRDGVVDSVDKELEALGKDFLKEYVPQFGDASMWMAGIIEEVAEGIVTDVRLPSQGEPVGKLEQDRDDKTFQADITKIDKDQQLVFGWVTITDIDHKPLVDTQGDLITPADMEKMAYAYVADVRHMGVMHEKVGGGELVESIVFTAEKQKALGIDLGRSGWWIGFHVTSPEVWARVKSGELAAFSIHGKGIRTKIAD